MKRIISLILCILCLISFSSCGMQRKIKRFTPDEKIISFMFDSSFMLMLSCVVQDFRNSFHKLFGQ